MSDSEWSKIPAPEGYVCVGYSKAPLNDGDAYLNSLGEYRFIKDESIQRYYLRFVKKWRPKQGEVCYFWGASEEAGVYRKFARMQDGLYKIDGGHLTAHCRPLTAEEKGE